MPGSFTVYGKEYSIPEDFNIGEICDAEEQFGVVLGDSTKLGVRAAAAMMWIAIRRQDPTVTVEDIKAMPLDIFQSVITEDEESPLGQPTVESSTSSGGSSTLNGETSDTDPVATGVPG